MWIERIIKIQRAMAYQLYRTGEYTIDEVKRKEQRTTGRSFFRSLINWINTITNLNQKTSI